MAVFLLQLLGAAGMNVFGAAVLQSSNGTINIPEKYAGCNASFICVIKNTATATGNSTFGIKDNGGASFGEEFVKDHLSASTDSFNVTGILTSGGNYSVVHLLYTPCETDRIVETYGSPGSSGWYRHYSSGWIEQGGNWEFSTGGTGWASGSISYPKPFLSRADILQYSWIPMSIYPGSPHVTGVTESAISVGVAWNANGIYSAVTLSGSWFVKGFIGGNAAGENSPDDYSIESFFVVIWDAQGGMDTDSLEETVNALAAALLQQKEELSGNLNTATAALNERIGALEQSLREAITKQETDQAVLLKQIQDFKNEINSLAADLQYNVARLERQQADYLAQLEILKTVYQKDVEMLNLKIGNLDSKYAAEVANIKADVAKIANDLSAVESQFLAADEQLKTLISSLEKQQTALQQQLNLAEQQHRNDVSAIQSQIDSKTELIRVEHSADVNQLTQQMSHLNSTYADKVSQINSQLDSISSALVQMARDYTEGDKELQNQIESLRLQQLTQQNALSNLQDRHAQDVAALEKELAAAQTALQEKIDAGVADLRQDMLALDNKYHDAAADLKSQLATANAKLESEVARLSETDRDLYDRISDLREKQADYYARMEILKVTHEKDKEAIEKEIAALDARYKEEVEAINAKIASVREEVAQLEAKHDEDVARLQKQIDDTVNNLDEEVRKIYLELDAVKSELADHKKATQEAIDNLQLQINEIDKSMIARLKNLENRIKYSVYSDEKLEELQADFVKQIQAKEKEIADLDLEIQDLRNAGLDISAQEETRQRLLSELLTLRNELTDIEFAIEIRHNESEFAEHEKEIALLKEELAALRDSTDLRIKQLKDDLLATEAKYLKLLEEAKLDAANQTASVQKQLDDLTASVLAFVDALRNERETGDAELKALLDAMDVSHKELIAHLDSTIAAKLDKMKFETDTQFENLRSTLNDIAYQQRFNTGGSGSSYSLPSSQAQEVPGDARDLRVSPDASFNSILN